ncbi:nucleotidyltransferase domain-containing protein [Paenibacillus sp. MMS20-IR301]|uniref:nucleotidyltransferase domain-containing protein n=1 Tax=Paenibacillus sp. MMS20-IR301 TaxID=2895946 RepID=UPI0028ECEC97|nr:nucleotidyltransferase domain-containing protein [Paenibacillus sp. MMS20-IR301]WNS41130.1 nucleotidyltransferase domain-containing protein [Paenibacillus sp. MMS20-IR301]
MTHLQMNAAERQRLLDRNELLIQMVIERAKRDFAEDIAIIGLTGSFSTGDYHAASDLDLIIINNTDRGWGISSCFILGEIGYDIYCTPWETRIESQAKLDSPMISHLVDMQILYCAKPEYMDKFTSYKQRALDMLAKPVGPECIRRAGKWMDQAKQEYTNTLLSDEIGAVRYAAGETVYNLLYALTHLNNTYFKRGIKRYLEEIGTFRYVPEDFAVRYMAVIEAGTQEEIRSSALALLTSVNGLYRKLTLEFVERPVPDYSSLGGTYEELWCNCRNKVLAGVEQADAAYLYHAALSAQNFLNEMSEHKGTPALDVMQYFDSGKLDVFRDQFLLVMDQYLNEYIRVGRQVERYASFQELYEQFMKG